MSATQPAIGSQLADYLERLKAGSRTAAADIFALALEPVIAFVISRNRAVSREDARDIAVDAIMSMISDPNGVDPVKGSAWSYLCMVAGRDATDQVRTRARQKRLLEKAGMDVELWSGCANNVEKMEFETDARNLLELYGAQLVTNEGERRLLALMLSSERETTEYAVALGLNVDDIDTPAIVKKAKDKMSVRLRRLGHEL
jgi:DNA-directed RNA polymerase specialized sigma24 family protein